MTLVNPRPEECTGTRDLFVRGDTLTLTTLHDLDDPTEPVERVERRHEPPPWVRQLVILRDQTRPDIHAPSADDVTHHVTD